jgi:phage shock protein C
MNPEPKRLFRSRTNRMLGGVCGGIAEFFVLDPTLVRVAFVLGTVMGFGALVFVYLAMLIIVPEAPLSGQPPASTPPAAG